MRYSEIILEKESEFKNGKYVAYDLSDDSKAKLTNFIKERNIPNPCDEDSFHVTLVYSKKDFPWKLQKDNPIVIEPKDFSFDIFKTSSGEKNCLVLRFDNDQLTQRQEDALSAGATSDFPTYKAHISLSYDVGDDFQIEILPTPDFEIDLVGEYAEPLKE